MPCPPGEVRVDGEGECEGEGEGEGGISRASRSLPRLVIAPLVSFLAVMLL